LECTENDYDRSIDDFILFCNKNGVEVNREEFVKDYTEGKESPPMIDYMWWRLNNNEIGGRYDISKKRRQTAD
jgi:hypothetical protein